MIAVDSYYELMRLRAENRKLRADVERLALAGEEANALYNKMSAEREELKAQIEKLEGTINYYECHEIAEVKKELDAANKEIERLRPLEESFISIEQLCGRKREE